MNIWDILILLAVAAALLAAFRTLRSRGNSCGCCPVKGTAECHCDKRKTGLSAER